jgi:hypothetical protein
MGCGLAAALRRQPRLAPRSDRVSDWLRNVDSVPDLQFDFEHTDGFVLVGIGTLVISLTAGYFLVRWGTLSNSLQRQRHAHQVA